MAKTIDANGLLVVRAETNGWGNDNVPNVGELHPDSTVSSEEIEQVLEYLATISLDICYDLIIGLDMDSLSALNL